MQIFLVIQFLSATNTTNGFEVRDATIAAIASGVVALLSLLSSILGWIITNHQNKKQYIRDFDVEMYKELLPALYSLADETKEGIEGRRVNGWKGYQESFKKVEKLYRGYSPFITPDIRKHINEVFDICRKKEGVNKIDDGMEDLINQVTKYTDSLVRRRK